MDRTQVVGLAPRYEQKYFPAEERRGRLRLVVSPDGSEGFLSMNQNALVFAGLVDADETAQWTLASDRKGYLHVAVGEVVVNGQVLSAGGGIQHWSL